MPITSVIAHLCDIPAVALLRPKQWIKNGVVLLPVFFSGNILHPSYWIGGMVMFLAFCLISSSVYCLNDIVDRHVDRKHPVKRQRPVASGAVTATAAYTAMAVTALLSLAACMLLGLHTWVSMACIAAYFFLNVAYCLWLKRISLLDVFVIALGFVLRIVAGGVATGITLSHWILLMTFLLALFLALAKRRDEVLIFERTSEEVRGNITAYTKEFLNQAIPFIAAITVVCYIMYTVSPEVTARMGTDYLYVTVVFVLAGMLRYLHLTVVQERSGSPVKTLYADRFLQCCVMAWLLSFVVFIYLI